MKTPPLLLAAALLFWGWQSDLLPVAAVLAVVLESPRFHKVRWEMSDADITRVWSFRSLLGLAAAIYAFTSNNGPSTFVNLLANPDLGNSRQAGNSSTLRRSPLSLAAAGFLLADDRPGVQHTRGISAGRHLAVSALPPQTVVKKPPAAAPGLSVQHRLALFRPLPDVRQLPYGGGCFLFLGIVRAGGWALWSRRPRGTAWYFWVLLLAGVIGAGFFGQRGFNQLSRLIDMADNYNPRFLLSWLQRQTADPKKARTSMGDRANLQLSSAIIIRVTPVNGAVVLQLPARSHLPQLYAPILDRRGLAQ